MNINPKRKKLSLRLLTALCAAAILSCGAVYAADMDTVASTEANPTFTNIIITSYEDSDPSSDHLIRINTLVNKTEFSFTEIANKAIDLANQNNIPSGWPVESRIVSTEFNPTGDHSISDGRKHCGMDISTRSQIIPIYATASGKVVTANYHSQYGNQVIIDHGNGFTTLYAHCDELMVSAGDKVKKGDIIATTGNTGMSTGIHCHYEIQLNGVYQNPRDYF